MRATSIGRFGGLFYCLYVPETTLRRSKSSSLARASKTAYLHTDKGFTHLAKWVTTDHTGFSRAMTEMPKKRFIASLRYTLTHLAISIIGTLISGVLIFILVAFGIPLLIKFLLT